MERVKNKVKRLRRNIGREIKEELKENFLNVPNLLTISRILIVFIAVYMLFSSYSRLSVAIVFGIAAFTDWLDGFFARKLKQTTSIGARLDQVIDRIFTLIIIVALIVYFIQYDLEGVLLLVLVSSREIIGSLGFFIRLVTTKDTYKVKYIGKLTTFVQSFTIAFIIADFSFAAWFAIATCILGIIAGYDYLKDSLS
jgi:CDP-diacylglycerol--glycerol-3-phosphate 3-phosphatidyltransferase